MEIRYTQVKYTFDAFYLILDRIEITSELHYDVINARISIYLEVCYTQLKYTFDAFYLILDCIEITTSELHSDVINVKLYSAPYQFIKIALKLRDILTNLHG